MTTKSNKTRIYVTNSKARKAIKHFPLFEDRVPPEDQPLDPSLLGDLCDYLFDLIADGFLVRADRLIQTQSVSSTPTPKSSHEVELQEEEEYIELDDSRLGDDLDF